MNECVVFGCGWAGTHHIETVSQSPYAYLKAVVDPDDGKRSIVCKAFNVPGFSCVDELDNSNISYTTGIIATPAESHFDLSFRLIANGKNVLCEKPVCRNSKEIEVLKNETKRTKSLFGVVFNQRYGFVVQKAKELIEKEGGSLHLITASMYQHWPTEISTGINETFMITDALCHLLDLSTFFGGPIEDIKSVSFKNESELISDVVAAVRFSNGCLGSISHSNVGGKIDTQHPFQHIDIHTSNARYRLENLFDSLTVLPHDETASHVYKPSVFTKRDYSESMYLACSDYLQAVHNGDAIPSDINQALINMKMLEEIIACSK
jgi:predicted dehydrogenase